MPLRAALLLLLAARVHAEPLREAFHQMYDLDFPAAHRLMDEYQAKNPKDPLGPTVRAAAYLFHEMDRLQILESEFLTDDKKISGKEKLTPDDKTRERFYAAIDHAQKLADARLAGGQDSDALLAYCMTEGMRMDYMALIEKKQLRSLSAAKRAHGYALTLIKRDPSYADAYMTTGVTEYLVGSLPFFIRWFVKFEQVDGNKATAVARLAKVAKEGRYLGPFARILLSLIHTREKRPREAYELLTGLSRDFPRNRLFRSEMDKLAKKLAKR